MFPLQYWVGQESNFGEREMGWWVGAEIQDYRRYLGIFRADQDSQGKPVG